MERILKFISIQYGIKYEDILGTLYNTSYLTPKLKAEYNKLSPYKNPATKLLSEKYSITLSEATSNNINFLITLIASISKYSISFSSVKSKFFL